MTRPQLPSVRIQHAARPVLSMLVWVASLCACGKTNQAPSTDSEAHWLRACLSDDDCGEFACECGICTTLCGDDQTCELAVGTPSICRAPATKDVVCQDIEASTPICIPDCSAGICTDTRDPVTPAATAGSDTVAAEPAPNETSLSASRQSLPSVAPVPACPEVASTTSLPALFFATDVDEYEGPATVTQVSPEQIVLTANARTDTQFQLRLRRSPPASLPVGRRVSVLTRGGDDGGSPYRLLVVRDEAGRLILATHSGPDVLYQEGLFASADTFGATLTLRMTCQSAVSDGCFENQVQAEYEGIFEGDNRLVHDGGAIVDLDIDGVTYAVTFTASSVDGGAPQPDCPTGLTPNRYVDFSLIER